MSCLCPPDRALVLCVDEQAQIHALDRSQPLLPPRPGQVERRTHDYRRHGTTTLFAALDVKTGTVVGERHRRHRAIEFRQFLATIEAAVPPDLDIHVILDNHSTHKTPAIRRWFAALAEQQLRRGVHRSTRELEAAITRDLAIPNEQFTPFVWTKTAEEILTAVARFYQRISSSGH